MLALFRKYQKIIFVFTTAVIILSFLFFGTMNSMGGAPEVKEETLMKAIDGSSVSVQKVDRMVQFLSSSQMNLKDDGAGSVNLLNAGALETLFLSTSLGAELAEKLKDQLEPELAKAAYIASSFEGYKHASAQFLSSEMIWGQFLPESLQLVHTLTRQRTSLSTERKFQLLSQGYLMHQKLPSNFVRKVLAYQVQQMGNVEEDPALPYADMSLCGLHTSKDWLGETYIRAAAQFIINAGAYARKQGYRVSTQEARQTLVARAGQAAQLLSRESASELDFYQVFLSQARNLGMSEKDCLDTWKDIALFEKLVFDVQNTVTVPEDKLPPPKEQALVEIYSLPDFLQLKDFTSLLKLQVYIEAVTGKKFSGKTPFALPSQMLSLYELEKKAPDLVQRSYKLEYSEIDLKKLSAKVGLKQTWAWQTSDEGWSQLQKAFSYLGQKSAQGKESRFAALEALSASQRAEVDSFSKESLLRQNPEGLKAELASMAPEVKTLTLSASGFELPFKGVSDLGALLALIEAKDASLAFYTGDGQHYYSIVPLFRDEASSIRTFKEADACGALRRMLDKKLASSYLEVRKKDSMPYMRKDGGWKPLSEVREKVAMASCRPMLQSIASFYKETFGLEPSKEELEKTDFYVNNALLYHLSVSRNQAMAQQDVEPQNPLATQWELTTKTETLLKQDHKVLETMVLEKNVWSSIVQLPSGSSKPYVFFQVKQELEPAPLAEEELETLKAPYIKEAQKALFTQIFSQIEQKEAMNLTKVAL